MRWASGKRAALVKRKKIMAAGMVGSRGGKISKASAWRGGGGEVASSCGRAYGEGGRGGHILRALRSGQAIMDRYGAGKTVVASA
jgi:hypothetical protein